MAASLPGDSITVPGAISLAVSLIVFRVASAFSFSFRNLLNMREEIMAVNSKEIEKAISSLMVPLARKAFNPRDVIRSDSGMIVPQL